MSKSPETNTLYICDRTTRKINRTDLAYTAGFLDGEGTICAGRKSRTSTHNCIVLRVIFYQTSRDVIDWLAERFGGRVTQHSPRGIGKRVSYRLTIRTRDQKWFLKLMIPFLRVKQQQARLALVLLAMTRRGSALERKLRILNRMKSLNGQMKIESVPAGNSGVQNVITNGPLTPLAL